MDFRDILAEKELIKRIQEETQQPGHILQSRNILLSKARGSVRQHLQMQLREALQKFHREEAPETPQQIT
jgi:hypothetical protein